MEKDKPIKVLQVVTIMDRGGLETMLMNYFRKIDRSKVQFDFLVHRLNRGHYDDEIERLGGEIYRLPPIRPGRYKQYFKALDDFFSTHSDYDIVHSHINENSSFVLRAAKKANIQCRIVHSHLSDVTFDIKTPFRLFARMMMQDYPTHYFACSYHAAKWMFGSKVKDKPPIVLPNAVDVERFQFDPDVRSRLRTELKGENQFIIGHVGRFEKQKNHEFLIDIFYEIKKRKSNSMLVLVGEGILQKRVEQKVKQLGLEKDVKFLGVRKDIPELMQAFDVFLFPSLFEGLPVVLVEAQAAGLRSIVSNTITKEVDLTGAVDFISLKKGAVAWAEAVLSISSERINTKPQLVEKGYDTRTMAMWLMDYYEKLLKASSAKGVLT